jgi:hypothetical protein
MTGSTFIHEPSPERFEALKSSDDLDGFERVDLNILTTIDFTEILAESELDWVAGEPLLYDEEAGIALFRIDPLGLMSVLDGEHGFGDEGIEDLESLRVFVDLHGADHIFELSTF